MNKSFIFFSVLIFLVVTLPLITLDTWMPIDIRLDTGDGAGTNSSEYPQIARSGTNVYAIWQDNRNGSPDIYFNYSTDYGLTWKLSEIRLDTGDTAGSGWSARPQITYFANYVYAVWEDSRNGYLDIYFNYSTDYGATWQSSAIRLDTGDTAGANESYFPQITCSENFVYAIWHDNRNGSPDIYFNYSADNGQSWQSSAIRLDTGDTAGSNPSEYPQITCSGTNVYAIWHDYRNGAGSDIYYNYSTNNGVNWQSSAVRLDTGYTAGASQSQYPQITHSGTNVYAVWDDSRNGSPDIYFNYSADNGQSWQSSSIRLDTGDIAGANSSSGPEITCSGNNVFVVWRDKRNGTYSDIYFNYSTDSGANWLSSDIRLDTGDTAGTNSSLSPRITCLEENVYTVWQDNRNGNYDIYFNYSSDYGATWQPSAIRLDTGDTAGANDSLYPQITCSENIVYAIWSDNRNGSPDIYFNRRARPLADIKANGSDGPIIITDSDTLQIRISLVSYGLADNVDFWLAYKGPFGWYHYNKKTKSWESGLNVSLQDALFDINPKNVFKSSELSQSNYWFYFGVDLVMDGKLTKSSLYYDEVKVTVIND